MNQDLLDCFTLILQNGITINQLEPYITRRNQLTVENQLILLHVTAGLKKDTDFLDLLSQTNDRRELLTELIQLLINKDFGYTKDFMRDILNHSILEYVDQSLIREFCSKYERSRFSTDYCDSFMGTSKFKGE